VSPVAHIRAGYHDASKRAGHHLPAGGLLQKAYLASDFVAVITEKRLHASERVDMRRMIGRTRWALRPIDVYAMSAHRSITASHVLSRQTNLIFAFELNILPSLGRVGGHRLCLRATRSFGGDATFLEYGRDVDRFFLGVGKDSGGND
jgi:hypothetical protein